MSHKLYNSYFNHKHSNTLSSGSLKNAFDQDKVQQELDLQVQVSQDFNRNGQSALAEINTKVKNALDEANTLEKQAKEAEARGDTVQANQLAQAAQAKRQSANNWQSAGVGLNMLISGLSAPTDSVVGVATATLAPAVSYEIGQTFKGLAKNNADGQLTDQQAAAHVLAHAVLGAAVAATGGNDALAGALSSGGAEAVAPKLSQFLYGTSDPEKLTAEQKETIANMSSLVGAGVGATIGNGSANAVQGSLNAENAVENNYLTYVTLEKVKNGEISQQSALNTYAINKENIERQCSASQSSSNCMTAINAAKAFIAHPTAKTLFSKQVFEINQLLRKYAYAAQYQPKDPSYKIDLSLNDLTGGNLPQGKSSDYAKGLLTGLQAFSWENIASATGGAQYGMPVGVLPYNQYETDNPYVPKTQQEFLGSTYGLPLVTSVASKAIPKLPQIGKGKGSSIQSKSNAINTIDGKNNSIKSITSEGKANTVTAKGLNLDLKTTQSANDVVDSLKNTGQLPNYYVTKNQAMQQGWQPGKALNNFVKDGQIGGDVFQNSTKILPEAQGRIWYEADIGLSSTSSRAKQAGTRLLYSNDGLLYITTDHYKTVVKIGTWK